MEGSNSKMVEQTPAQPQPQTQVAKKDKFSPEISTGAIDRLPAQLKMFKECFAKPFNSFRQAFVDPKEADRKMAKEIEFASQAMMSNDFLVKCAMANPEDLVNSLKNIALTGSTLNPVLKQGYLVPFKNRITFMPSYMGLTDMLMRTGLVKKIEAHTVHEGDEFEIEFGANAHLIHKPNPWTTKTEKNCKGAYYYVVLADGTEMYDVMNIEEINKIKERSPSSNSKNPTPWQTDFLEMAKKGLALDTLIPTPTGFTTMADISVGDEVFNALGEVTRVTSKSEVKHLPCYKVTFQNGDSFVCDSEHKWFVRGTVHYGIKGWSVCEAKDLATIKKLGYPITTPKIKPTILPNAELPINPYVLGYWLGNGSVLNASVSCDSKDADEIMSHIIEHYDVSKRKDHRSNSCVLNISSKGKRNEETSLFCQLRKLGETEGKFIPDIYKRASIEQRIELIQGMCDSDGCAHAQRGRCMWGSVNKQMAEDFFEIVSSLGERAVFTSKVAKGYGKEVMFYEVQWQPAYFLPFRLQRKLNKCKKKTFNCVNCIKSIEPVESVPTQCIAVDSFGAEDENDLRKSYAIGRGFYITHNTQVRRAFKSIPKSEVSESKLKVLEVSFDYDEKVEQDWVKSIKTKKTSNFDEEEPIEIEAEVVE